MERCTKEELEKWSFRALGMPRWDGLSRDCAGGEPIADTGDFNDPLCPMCIKKDDCVVVDDYVEPDAQATIAALQARVKELEARQHFGACAKCLTNAWRICKEGTPDAVEMKCSNGSTWWLCDYCLSKEQLTQRTAERDTARRRVDELEAREVDVVLLREDLEKRTAELERVRGERDDMQRAAQGMSNDLTGIGQKYDELRTLIAALPKVEGEVEVYHHESGLRHSVVARPANKYYSSFDTPEEAGAYAAILKHRQGMEG